MSAHTPQAALLSALAEFNRYFTSANGVDVSARISVPRDEWRALHAAILAKLQATHAEPVQAPPVPPVEVCDWCGKEAIARVCADHKPVQAVELPDEREAFEQWASDNGEFPRAVARSGDVYHLMATQTYWLAWQARAALSSRKPLTDETFVAACNGCPTPGKCKDTGGCASAGMNVPTYYVRHPDDTYTAADPQPRFNGIGLEVKP